MEKGNYLNSILRSQKTVFTSKDLALIWQEPLTAKTWVRIQYYIRKGDLFRVRNGIYTKKEDYNRLELATRIYAPSYVSFETVLVKEGLIFQYYENISVASYLDREVTVDHQIYTFRKVKTKVLVNSVGVDHSDETSIATKERAFLDILYVNSDYHFDNLGGLQWEKVFELLPIYGIKRLEKQVNTIYKTASEEHHAP